MSAICGLAQANLLWASLEKKENMLWASPVKSDVGWEKMRGYMGRPVPKAGWIESLMHRHLNGPEVKWDEWTES